MPRELSLLGVPCLLPALGAGAAQAELSQRVVEIPTRPGVTQRFVLLAPAKPKAAIILFAGGHGGLQIRDDGSYGWGKGNFLVRSREHFAERDLVVAVLDAPSDRQSAPFLGGFRQTPQHAEDVRAVVAWLREYAKTRSGSLAPAAVRSPSGTSPRSSSGARGRTGSSSPRRSSPTTAAAPCPRWSSTS